MAKVISKDVGLGLLRSDLQGKVTTGEVHPSQLGFPQPAVNSSGLRWSMWTGGGQHEEGVHRGLGHCLSTWGTQSLPEERGAS